MQPKGLALVKRAGEEIKQPHFIRTDVTGCKKYFPCKLWTFWLVKFLIFHTIFALQNAVFEEVYDRGALFLVQPTHRGFGHGLREPHFDVV